MVHDRSRRVYGARGQYIGLRDHKGRIVMTPLVTSRQRRTWRPSFYWLMIGNMTISVALGVMLHMLGIDGVIAILTSIVVYFVLWLLFGAAVVYHAWRRFRRSRY